MANQDQSSAQSQPGSDAGPVARAAGEAAPSAAFPAGLLRTINGEVLYGMEVAGYRWKTPIALGPEADNWAYSYASHWSTPAAHENADRLYAEADVLRLIEVAEAARLLITEGLRLTPDALVVREKADRSDPHWRLCAPLEDAGLIPASRRAVARKVEA